MTSSEIWEEIKAIQAAMLADPVVVEAFDDEDRNNLCIIIRITVEVSVGLAKIAGRQDCSEEAGFHLETVLSGLAYFRSLSRLYNILTIFQPSEIAWESLSETRLLSEIERKYREFRDAREFPEKCRKLLDLYKLQLALVAVCYPA